MSGKGNNQKHFHVCQKCHAIVDQIYQMSYCKECLVEYFKKYHPLLNKSHALTPSKPVRKKSL